MGAAAAGAGKVTARIAQIIAYRVFRVRGHGREAAKELVGYMTFKPHHAQLSRNDVAKSALMASMQARLATAAAWRIATDSYPGLQRLLAQE